MHETQGELRAAPTKQVRPLERQLSACPEIIIPENTARRQIERECQLLGVALSSTENALTTAGHIVTFVFICFSNKHKFGF